jgi:TnpA family transposase
MLWYKCKVFRGAESVGLYGMLAHVKITDLLMEVDRWTGFTRHFTHLKTFAAHWGEGKTSSSDGQRFRAGGRGEAGGQVNLKYGNGPGVTFYTHVSDQYAPFHMKVINAAVRDATHVLDGLLYHESDLRIEEHYTDTAGFTDHVFGLCHLLGFRFAPRIRDLADKRLYVPGKATQWSALLH